MKVSLSWGVPSYDEPVCEIRTVFSADARTFVYECAWLDANTGRRTVSKGKRPFVVGDFVSEHHAHIEACRLVAHCGKTAAKFHTMRLRSIA